MYFPVIRPQSAERQPPLMARVPRSLHTSKKRSVRVAVSRDRREGIPARAPAGAFDPAEHGPEVLGKYRGLVTVTGVEADDDVGPGAVDQYRGDLPSDDKPDAGRQGAVDFQVLGVMHYTEHLDCLLYTSPSPRDS